MFDENFWYIGHIKLSEKEFIPTHRNDFNVVLRSLQISTEFLIKQFLFEKDSAKFDAKHFSSWT